MVTYIEKSDVRDVRTKLLWHHKANAQQTATGYGRKLATEYQVQLADKRWRRVYVCQISNAGTAYVLVDKEWRVISDYGDVAEMLRKACRSLAIPED